MRIDVESRCEFRLGTGEPGRGEFQFSLQARARQAREVKPDDDDVPASGAAGRRRRGRSVRGRVSSGWLELQRVRISVRKRVSSPTRIPARQAALGGHDSHVPRAHTGRHRTRRVMRAGLHFRDGISALFRSPARPGTRDRRCIREQHIAVEYFSLGPGPISNARAHAALGLVNDLKCQSTRRPRSR